MPGSPCCGPSRQCSHGELHSGKPGSRWRSAQKASEWLSRQLESFKAKLEKSEDDLQEYAQKNGLLFLETQKGDTENIVNERLRELQDELTKAQAERYKRYA